MQERSYGQDYDFVDVDQLTPLGQFRDWIEKPENLNLWMQYPQSLGEERIMGQQVNEVLNHPDEVLPKVIFNVAIKSADLAGYDGNPKNASLNMLSAYINGLAALSRSNKFSMQEHGHYWNTLTTLLNSQSIFVQQGERKMASRAVRRGNTR